MENTNPNNAAQPNTQPALTKFICKDCQKEYELAMPAHVWYIECECGGMAIKGGYTIEGKKREDMVALAKRRSQNQRMSMQAMEMAAQHRHSEEAADPDLILTKPHAGSSPGSGASQGPLKIKQSVYESIKIKGKEVMRQEGVPEEVLK